MVFGIITYFINNKHLQLLLKAASNFPIQTYMPYFAACWTKVSRDLILHCPDLGFGYDQVKFHMKCSEMF